ncbi:MAG: carboxypeptidase-like regulatory domain-containing protein [Sulfolobaceae archaeon]
MNVPDVITKPGRLFSISISIPSVISAGSSISGKVLQTLMGSSTSSPAPNVTVVIQITSAGKVLSTLITNTGSDGSFSLKIPSQLPAGRYNLIMYAYTQDSVLVYPYMYSTIVTPPPTTTMTTTTTLPTTTTLTTPPSLPTTTTTSAGGGISTSIIIAVVVIIIIIIIAVILLRRR